MLADELLENAWTQCLTVQTNFYVKNGPQQHLQSWHPQQNMPTSCSQNTGLRPAIRPSRGTTTSASTWWSLQLSIMLIQFGLSLHATGLTATQHIQHQEDGVKCDNRKNYKYSTIKWSIEIKTLFQQKRISNICKWVSIKLGIVSKDGSFSVILSVISK